MASMQQRKKENLLLLQIAGTLLFVVQYILTGKITGAILFTIKTEEQNNDRHKDLCNKFRKRSA
jgi:hypothetical protein